MPLPAASTATPAVATPHHAPGGRVWVERLKLTNFRNYAELALNVGPGLVVLTGPNGAAKQRIAEILGVDRTTLYRKLKRYGFHDGE